LKEEGKIYAHEFIFLRLLVSEVKTFAFALQASNMKRSFDIAHKLLPNGQVGGKEEKCG